MIRLILLLFCFSIANAQNFTINSTSETGERLLDNAAIYRLSELYKFAPGLTTYSTDGFRYSVIPFGFGGTDGRNTRIFLDGQEIDAGMFGFTRINYLPVNTKNISSVVFVETPRMYNGELLSPGTVLITTKNYEKKHTFSVGVMAGNETGDPGPYRYTGGNRLNVDQIGPEYYAGYYGNMSKFGFGFNIRNNSIATTDEAIYKRTENYKWEYRDLNLTAISGKLTYRTAREYHSFFAGYTANGTSPIGGHQTSDLLYLDIIGKEIPVNTEMIHAGINGKTKINSGYSAGYSVLYTRNSIIPFLSFQPASLDLQKETVKGKIYLGKNFDNFNISTGYTIRQRNVQSSYMPGSRVYSLHGFSVDASRKFTDRFTGSLASGVVIYKNKHAVNIALASEYDFDSYLFDFTAGYVENLPEENPASVHYLAAETYPFITYESSKLAGFINKPAKSNTLYTNIFIQKNITGFKIRPGVFYKKFGGYSFGSHRHVWLENSNEATTITPRFYNINGSIFGGKVYVEKRISRLLDINASFVYKKYTGGNTGIIEGKIPEFTFSGSTVYSPLEKLSVFVYLGYRSSTIRDEYSTITEETDGEFDHRINSSVNLDFNVHYLMWNKKIEVDLLFKNILNTGNNTHPLGGGTDFTLLFNLRFITGL